MLQILNVDSIDKKGVFMIRERAREMLEAVKNNVPSYNYLDISDKETESIVNYVVNECKSSIVMPGESQETRNYGSRLDISIVEKIVKTFINNKPQIDSNIVEQIYTSYGLTGINIPLKYNKETDETGKMYLSVQDERSSILSQEFDIDGFDVLDETILTPYIKSVMNSSDENKRFDSSAGIEKYKQKLTEQLARKGKDTSRVNAIAGFLEKDIVNNEDVKQKIVEYVTNEIEKNSDVKYEDVLGNLVRLLFHRIEDTITKQDIRKHITQIFNDTQVGLMAIGTGLRGKDSNEISETLKQINQTTIQDSNEKRSIDLNTGYRDVNVGISSIKLETGETDPSVLSKKEDVPEAMQYLTEEIEDLLKKVDTMEDSEYIKEVARIKYRFIRIHPFPDGNGRASRALTNMLMQEKGSIIEFDKKEKGGYTDIMTIIHGTIKDSDETQETKYLQNLAKNPDACKEVEEDEIKMLADYIQVQHLNYIGPQAQFIEDAVVSKNIDSKNILEGDSL